MLYSVPNQNVLTESVSMKLCDFRTDVMYCGLHYAMGRRFFHQLGIL